MSEHVSNPDELPRRVRDYPIIFSAPMVRALLEGRKTQTRRLAGRWRVTGDAASPEGETGVFVPSPWQRVQPGDRLFVRETVACGECAPSKPSYWSPSFWRREQGSPKNRNGLWYQADGLEPERQITARGRWTPSIHMPRWASRLTLTVTAVKVERLQEISEADAWAEGIHRIAHGSHFGWHHTRTLPHPMNWLLARDAFRDLWNSLHGPGAWDANPEVVALSFTVARRNIDAPLRCEAADE
jgi:hypothetical protein